MIDVVMVTNGKRADLLHQSLDSLHDNCTEEDQMNVVVVHDGLMSPSEHSIGDVDIDVRQCGASRCRNIGASSVPKYRRGQYVMFVDDDVYMCPGWDERFTKLVQHIDVVSGHAHPFNHTVLDERHDYIMTTVLSTVNLFMPWETWDQVGYFAEPGGPGGSEVVDWCKRAQEHGSMLLVTKPHCVIHTGLTNSKGEWIVGYEQVAKR